jgi:hypothetical protein
VSESHPTTFNNKLSHDNIKEKKNTIEKKEDDRNA